MNCYASIDMGSNSILLTIVKHNPQTNQLTPIVEETNITRLGKGIVPGGSLNPENVSTSLNVLEKYAHIIKNHNAHVVKIVGTEALRQAHNTQAFIDQVTTIFNTPAYIISGEQEAFLTYKAVSIDLKTDKQAAIIDIGGASTEVIFGTKQSMKQALSLQMGAVTLTEAYLKQDPPQLEQLEQLSEVVRNQLKQVPQEKPEQLFGIAGTFTTLSAMHMKLEPYDSNVIHGSALSFDQLKKLYTQITTIPFRTRKELPGLPEKRADVIIAGCTIAIAILEHFGMNTITIGDRGIRWGLLYEYFQM